MSRTVRLLLWVVGSEALTVAGIVAARVYLDAPTWLLVTLLFLGAVGALVGFALFFREVAREASEARTVTVTLPKKLVDTLDEFARRDGVNLDVLLYRWLGARVREEIDSLAAKRVGNNPCGEEPLI